MNTSPTPLPNTRPGPATIPPPAPPKQPKKKASQVEIGLLASIWSPEQRREAEKIIAADDAQRDAARREADSAQRTGNAVKEIRELVNLQPDTVEEAIKSYAQCIRIMSEYNLDDAIVGAHFQVVIGEMRSGNIEKILLPKLSTVTHVELRNILQDLKDKILEAGKATHQIDHANLEIARELQDKHVSEVAKVAERDEALDAENALASDYRFQFKNALTATKEQEEAEKRAKWTEVVPAPYEAIANAASEMHYESTDDADKPAAPYKPSQQYQGLARGRWLVAKIGQPVKWLSEKFEGVANVIDRGLRATGEATETVAYYETKEWSKYNPIKYTVRALGWAASEAATSASIVVTDLPRLTKRFFEYVGRAGVNSVKNGLDGVKNIAWALVAPERKKTSERKYLEKVLLDGLPVELRTEYDKILSTSEDKALNFLRKLKEVNLERAYEEIKKADHEREHAQIQFAKGTTLGDMQTELAEDEQEKQAKPASGILAKGWGLAKAVVFGAKGPGYYGKAGSKLSGNWNWGGIAGKEGGLRSFFYRTREEVGADGKIVHSESFRPNLAAGVRGIMYFLNSFTDEMHATTQVDQADMRLNLNKAERDETAKLLLEDTRRRTLYEPSGNEHEKAQRVENICKAFRSKVYKVVGTNLTTEQHTYFVAANNALEEALKSIVAKADPNLIIQQFTQAIATTESDNERIKNIAIAELEEVMQTNSDQTPTGRGAEAKEAAYEMLRRIGIRGIANVVSRRGAQIGAKIAVTMAKVGIGRGIAFATAGLSYMNKRVNQADVWEGAIERLGQDQGEFISTLLNDILETKNILYINNNDAPVTFLGQAVPQAILDLTGQERTDEFAKWVHYVVRHRVTDAQGVVALVKEIEKFAYNPIDGTPLAPYNAGGITVPGSTGHNPRLKQHAKIVSDIIGDFVSGRIGGRKGSALTSLQGTRALKSMRASLDILSSGDTDTAIAERLTARASKKQGSEKSKNVLKGILYGAKDVDDMVSYVLGAGLYSLSAAVDIAAEHALFDLASKLPGYGGLVHPMAEVAELPSNLVQGGVVDVLPNRIEAMMRGESNADKLDNTVRNITGHTSQPAADSVEEVLGRAEHNRLLAPTFVRVKDWIENKITGARTSSSSASSGSDNLDGSAADNGPMQPGRQTTPGVMGTDRTPVRNAPRNTNNSGTPLADAGTQVPTEAPADAGTQVPTEAPADAGTPAPTAPTASGERSTVGRGAATFPADQPDETPANRAAPRANPVLDEATLTGLQTALPMQACVMDASNSARGREGVIMDAIDAAQTNATHDDVFTRERAGRIANVLENKVKEALGSEHNGDTLEVGVQGSDFVVRNTRNGTPTEVRVPVTEVLGATGLTAAEHQRLSGNSNAEALPRAGRVRSETSTEVPTTTSETSRAVTVETLNTDQIQTLADQLQGEFRGRNIGISVTKGSEPDTIVVRTRNRVATLHMRREPNASGNLWVATASSPDPTQVPLLENHSLSRVLDYLARQAGETDHTEAVHESLTVATRAVTLHRDNAPTSSHPTETLNTQSTAAIFREAIEVDFRQNFAFDKTITAVNAEVRDRVITYINDLDLLRGRVHGDALSGNITDIRCRIGGGSSIESEARFVTLHLSIDRGRIYAESTDGEIPKQEIERILGVLSDETLAVTHSRNREVFARVGSPAANAPTRAASAANTTPRISRVEGNSPLPPRPAARPTPSPTTTEANAAVRNRTTLPAGTRWAASNSPWTIREVASENPPVAPRSSPNERATSSNNRPVNVDTTVAATNTAPAESATAPNETADIPERFTPTRSTVTADTVRSTIIPNVQRALANTPALRGYDVTPSTTHANGIILTHRSSNAGAASIEILLAPPTGENSSDTVVDDYDARTVISSRTGTNFYNNTRTDTEGNLVQVITKLAGDAMRYNAQQRAAVQQTLAEQMDLSEEPAASDENSGTNQPARSATETPAQTEMRALAGTLNRIEALNSHYTVEALINGNLRVSGERDGQYAIISTDREGRNARIVEEHRLVGVDNQTHGTLGEILGRIVSGRTQPNPEVANRVNRELGTATPSAETRDVSTPPSADSNEELNDIDDSSDDLPAEDDRGSNTPATSPRSIDTQDSAVVASRTETTRTRAPRAPTPERTSRVTRAPEARVATSTNTVRGSTTPATTPTREAQVANARAVPTGRSLDDLLNQVAPGNGSGVVAQAAEMAGVTETPVVSVQRSVYGQTRTGGRTETGSVTADLAAPMTSQDLDTVTNNTINAIRDNANLNASYRVARFYQVNGAHIIRITEKTARDAAQGAERRHVDIEITGERDGHVTGKMRGGNGIEQPIETVIAGAINSLAGNDTSSAESLGLHVRTHNSPAASTQPTVSTTSRTQPPLQPGETRIGNTGWVSRANPSSTQERTPTAVTSPRSETPTTTPPSAPARPEAGRDVAGTSNQRGPRTVQGDTTRAEAPRQAEVLRADTTGQSARVTPIATVRGFAPVNVHTLDPERTPGAANRVINERLRREFANEAVGEVMDDVREDFAGLNMEGAHDQIVALRMMDNGYTELHQEAEALADYLHNTAPGDVRLARIRNITAEQIEAAVAECLDEGNNISGYELMHKLNIPLDDEYLSSPQHSGTAQIIASHLYNIAGYAGGLRVPAGQTHATIERAIREGEERLNVRVDAAVDTYNRAQGRGPQATTALYNYIADIDRSNSISSQRSGDEVNMGTTVRTTETGRAANERNLLTLLETIHPVTDTTNPTDVVRALEEIRKAGEAHIARNPDRYPNHRVSTPITAGSTIQATISDAQLEAVRIGLVRTFTIDQRDPSHYEEQIATDRPAETTNPRTAPTAANIPTTISEAERTILTQINDQFRGNRNLDDIDHATLNNARNTIAERVRARLNNGESVGAEAALLPRMDAVLLRQDVALRTANAVRERLARQGIIVSAADLERNLLSRMSIGAAGGLMLEGNDLGSAEVTGGGVGIGIMFRPFTIESQNGRGTISIAEFGGAIGVSNEGVGGGFALNLVNLQYRVSNGVTIEAGAPIAFNPLTLDVGASVYAGVRVALGERWDLTGRIAAGINIGSGLTPSFGAMLGASYNQRHAYEAARARIIERMHMLDPTDTTLSVAYQKERVHAILGIPLEELENNDARVRSLYRDIWAGIHTDAAQAANPNGFSGGGIMFGYIRDSRGAIAGVGPYAEFTVGSRMVMRYSPDSPSERAQVIHDRNTDLIHRLRNTERRTIGNTTVQGDASLRVVQVGMNEAGELVRTNHQDNSNHEATVTTTNHIDTQNTIKNFLREIAGVNLENNNLTIARPNATREYRFVSLVPGINVESGANGARLNIGADVRSFNVVRRVIISGPALTGGEHSTVEVIAFLPDNDPELQQKLTQITEAPREYIALHYTVGGAIRAERRVPAANVASASAQADAAPSGAAVNAPESTEISEAELTALVGTVVQASPNPRDRALLDRVFIAFASDKTQIAGFRNHANVARANLTRPNGDFDTFAYFNRLNTYVKTEMRNRLHGNERFSDEMNWASVTSALMAAANVSNISNLTAERQRIEIERRLRSVGLDPAPLFRDTPGNGQHLSAQVRAGASEAMNEIREHLPEQVRVGVGTNAGQRIPGGHMVRVHATLTTNPNEHRSGYRTTLTSDSDSFRAVAYREHTLDEANVSPNLRAFHREMYNRLVTEDFVRVKAAEFFASTLSREDKARLQQISARLTPDQRAAAERLRQQRGTAEELARAQTVLNTLGVADAVFLQRMASELSTLASGIRTAAISGETSYVHRANGREYPIQLHAQLNYGAHAGGTTHEASIGNCGNMIFDADLVINRPGTVEQRDVSVAGANDAMFINNTVQGRRTPGLNLVLGFAFGFRQTESERPGHPNGGNPRIPRQPRDADHPNGANPLTPRNS